MRLIYGDPASGLRLVLRQWPSHSSAGLRIVWHKGGTGMTERLRVGVVGTSWFAENVHLAGLNSHPGADITALCSRNRANAEEVASRHGGPSVFTDYREMIHSGLVDAVVIVTPDHLHHDIALEVLAAGLHVMCEKPLARTGADARAMFEAARATGLVHMSMLTSRWLAVPAFAKRLISEGYIGRWRDAQFSMTSNYGDDLADEWRFDPDRGTGILGDLGSHLIDMARWYVGEIVQVTGRLTRTHVARPGREGADVAPLLPDSATLMVEFEGGATGTIQVSGARSVGDWPLTEVRLFGDEGSLKLDFSLDTVGHVFGWRPGDESWSDLEIPQDLLGTGGPNPPILDLADSSQRRNRTGSD